MKILLSLFLVAGFAFAEPTILNNQILVSATVTSTLRLAANKNRKYLIIINNGSQTVYVKMGSAHTTTEGIPIVAGGNWEPIQTPIDSVYLKSASGTQSVSINEGN